MLSFSLACKTPVHIVADDRLSQEQGLDAANIDANSFAAHDDSSGSDSRHAKTRHNYRGRES
jgi:hypothetical protein